MPERMPSRLPTPYPEHYRGRRVMITGGLGFIGSNLARALLDAGADVLLVDSLIPDYGGNLFNVAGVESRLTINVADIRQQIESRQASLGTTALQAVAQ